MIKIEKDNNIQPWLFRVTMYFTVKMMADILYDINVWS
jgi:hypothetical protein